MARGFSGWCYTAHEPETMAERTRILTSWLCSTPYRRSGTRWPDWIRLPVDLSLEYDVVLDAIPVSAADFQESQKPLLAAGRREGIPVG